MLPEIPFQRVQDAELKAEVGMRYDFRALTTV